jgi:hypothetical protein
MVVALPIAQHDKISRNDEKKAVRAENCRAFKLTEVAVGITEMDYTCSLNLRGLIPQAITNKAVPGQMHGAPAAIGFRTLFRASVTGPLLRTRCLPLGSTVLWSIRSPFGCSAEDAVVLFSANPAIGKL